MAERHSERLGPLEVENSTEDSEDSESEMESQSESEEQPKELPPPNELQVGDLRASTSGNAMAVSGNEVETPIAGSSVHTSQNNNSEGVPGISIQREESKEQDMMTQQEVMAGVTGEALQPPAMNLLVSSPVCQTSGTELSPASVAQSMSSVSNVGNSCISVKSSSQKPSLTLAVVKASGADGYNWRKYGQKQVKSPQGSRSYFRCTYSDCCAKKIEFCDHPGHVMETIYKSQHNHDPPRKVNSVRQSRTVKTAGPVMESNATEPSFRVLSDSNPSVSSKESVQDTSLVPEGRPQDSTGFNGDAKITSKREDDLESEPKHRGRKKESSHSSPVLKPGKKPKFVVHAAGDVAISGDGYRWRKYGQKMVKGKPHPRNYYRCTSAGCPARKHIETAVDNASAVIITYKGIHDHDMPVPKKRHGLPSALLVAAASPASLSSSQGKKPDPSPNQKSPAQGPVDAEDLTGDALELGGEKAMESARTLLSIGFEIRPC